LKWLPSLRKQGGQGFGAACGVVNHNSQSDLGFPVENDADLIWQNLRQEFGKGQLFYLQTPGIW
jgi:hypothetical protein